MLTEDNRAPKIIPGSILFLPEEGWSRWDLIPVSESGKLGHPVLVVSQKISELIDVAGLTTFGQRTLSERFPGRGFLSKRAEYIPLHFIPQEPHPDKPGYILYFTPEEGHAVLQKRSYVRLEPFRVPASALRTLREGEARLAEKSLRLVRSEIKRLHPGYEFDRGKVNEGKMKKPNASHTNNMEGVEPSRTPRPIARPIPVITQSSLRTPTTEVDAILPSLPSAVHRSPRPYSYVKPWKPEYFPHFSMPVTQDGHTVSTPRTDTGLYADTDLYTDTDFYDSASRVEQGDNCSRASTSGDNVQSSASSTASSTARIHMPRDGSGLPWHLKWALGLAVLGVLVVIVVIVLVVKRAGPFRTVNF